jgi:hypothetical protein
MISAVRLLHVVLAVLTVLLAGYSLAGRAVDRTSAGRVAGIAVTERHDQAPTGALALEEGDGTNAEDGDAEGELSAHDLPRPSRSMRRWARPVHERSPSAAELGRETPPPRT